MEKIKGAMVLVIIVHFILLFVPGAATSVQSEKEEGNNKKIMVDKAIQTEDNINNNKRIILIPNKPSKKMKQENKKTRLDK